MHVGHGTASLSVRVTFGAEGRQSIPRLDPGTQLNQRRLHKQRNTHGGLQIPMGWCFGLALAPWSFGFDSHERDQRVGQTSPHKTRLVVFHSTCSPLSPSPQANSFVIGTARSRRRDGEVSRTRGGSFKNGQESGKKCFEDLDQRRLWPATRTWRTF